MSNQPITDPARAIRAAAHAVRVLVALGALLYGVAVGANPDEPQFKRELKTGGELEIQVTLPAPASRQNTNACVADVEIDYQQRGDQFDVLTRVSGPDCANAYGTYTVRARTADADQRIDTRRFEERWQISDDSLFATQRSYPMNGATDLLWVRVSANTCTCEDPE